MPETHESLQRLPGISHEDATGLAKEILDSSDILLGRTANLVRILSMHSPFLARWYLGFTAAVRQPALGASTDVRLRSLACIKTSLVNECTYCTAHTSIYGAALGLKTEEFEAMQGDYENSPLFNEREKATIAWAEAMTTNTAKKNGKHWDDMKRLFTSTEIVEISMAVGLFNMANRFNDTFWSELESLEYNQRQAGAIHRTVDDIEAFASRFAPTGRAERERRKGVAAD
jgi:alkylhydroperoxidase family enzyme